MVRTERDWSPGYSSKSLSWEFWDEVSEREKEGTHFMYRVIGKKFFFSFLFFLELCLEKLMLLKKQKRKYRISPHYPVKTVSQSVKESDRTYLSDHGGFSTSYPSIICWEHKQESKPPVSTLRLSCPFRVELYHNMYTVLEDDHREVM